MPDVRMRGFKDRADVDEVLALIRERIGPLPAELVSLAAVAGRVLAEDVVAEVSVPHFDRAAMDGYALRGEETFGASDYNPLVFQVVGESMPGRPFTGTVSSGQAVQIMTGAPLPAGADAVIMAEDARLLGARVARVEHGCEPPVHPSGGFAALRPQAPGDQVEITDAVPPGRNVSRRGEDIETGTVVLRAARQLRPQDVGLLSSIGVAQVPVYTRPRVAIIITGDELLPPGTRPSEYRIADSNSVMLAALVRRDGGIPQVMGPIPDQRDHLQAAILGALADCILVSGGSSVGLEDHAPQIIAEHGELAIHGVAMRPSSPAGLGFLPSQRPELAERGELSESSEPGTSVPGSACEPGDERTSVRAEPDQSPRAATRGLSTPDPRPLIPVFLLPGNPVSCLCAYDFFAGPAIRRMGARSMDWPYRTVTLPLGRKISSAVGRVDYVRVRIESGQVIPVSTSGASILSSTTRAAGFVIVGKDSEGHAPGQSVLVYLYG